MMKREKKWRIYIVAHNRIIDSMYKGDKNFNNENYVFLNVGSKVHLDNAQNYSCINQYDLDGSVQLGK